MQNIRVSVQTFYFLSTFASEHCHGQFVLRRRPCIRASVSVNIFIYVFDPFFDTRFLHHPSFALCIVWLPSLCLAFSLSRVPFAIHQDRAASDPVATSSIYSSSLAQRAAETTAQTTTTSISATSATSAAGARMDALLGRLLSLPTSSKGVFT